MKTNLTAAYVEKVAPPPSGQQDIYDGKERGLILRLADSGRKTWCIFYRHEGRNRRLTLGTYPKLSLADARDLAKKHLRDAALGSDPAAAKQARRAADTFGELADTYLEQYAKKKKRTWTEDERLIEKELKPAWGNRKATEIVRADVKALLGGIVERGSPIAANRTASLVSKIFNFGIDADVITTGNPAFRVSKEEEHSRDRVLCDSEIKTLWSALDIETPKAIAFFKLGLLLAQRRGELLGAQWSEIDLDSGWWTIPGERTKNRLSHRVPLIGQALKIIRQLKDAAKADVPHLFPGPHGKAVTNPQKWLARIREATEMDFKYHDLRRTAASHMTGDCQVTRFVVAQILNHKESGVTQIYDRHSYDAEKRAALQKWDARVNQIVTGERAKVVPIRG